MGLNFPLLINFTVSFTLPFSARIQLHGSKSHLDIFLQIPYTSQGRF